MWIVFFSNNGNYTKLNKGCDIMIAKQPMILLALFCGLALGSIIEGVMPINKYTVILLLTIPVMVPVLLNCRHIGEFDVKGKLILIGVSTMAIVIAYSLLFFGNEFMQYFFTELMNRYELATKS